MAIFSLSNAQLSAMHMDNVTFAMIEIDRHRGLREANVSAVICGGATVLPTPRDVATRLVSPTFAAVTASHN